MEDIPGNFADNSRLGWKIQPGRPVQLVCQADSVEACTLSVLPERSESKPALSTELVE
jgi:hypothetical protein